MNTEQGVKAALDFDVLNDTVDRISLYTVGNLY
jgi:hypothetical protein